MNNILNIYPDIENTIDDSIKIKFEECIKDPRSFYYNFISKEQGTDSKLSGENIKMFTREKTEDDYNDSTFLNPTKKVWLQIALYGEITLQFLLGFSILFLAVEFENILIFFGGILILVIVHISFMVSLNIAFNIQSIKENLSDIKKSIDSNKTD